MNFPFKKLGAVLSLRPRKSRLVAVWVRDPRTGRLIQTWQDAGDSDRSCTVRPRGPLSDQTWAGGRFRRAA